MALFRKWMTRNITKTVEAVVEPAKDVVAQVKENAGNRIDLYSKIVILAVEAIVGYFLLSESHREQDRAADGRSTLPGSIVINNYISTDKKEEQEHEHQ